MAEIINLNRVRKARAKAEAKLEAERNRVTFGRRRSDKDSSKQAAEADRRDLDGKKLEDAE